MKQKDRLQANVEDLALIVTTISKKLEKKINSRGFGIYCSVHEIYGIIAEEVHELMEATHKNNYKEFDDELIDIAVACLWGLISMKVLRRNKIYE